MTSSRRRFLAFTGILVLLIGLVLGPFLFSADGSIPSHRGGDTVRYHAAVRSFFVGEVWSGNFPLWNPHTFSGTPFVGMFQSAVFHPSGLLYLILPLSTAVSVDFALHLLLLGLFTFAWLNDRGHTALAAGFAALATVFGAGCFLRVAAGQFAVLGTIVWTPLLWLCVEHLLKRPSLQWVLIGSGATAIMAFAGHPPTLYMAGFATAAYAVAVWWSMSMSKSKSMPDRQVVGAILAIPIIAFLLSAAQIWTGLEVAAEGVRHAGGTVEFATPFSMPPENLLTFLVPDLYVDIVGRRLTYWGRWFYWDTSAFMGVVALVFAVHGAITTRGARRNSAIALFVLFSLLSLGRYTPLYEILFDVVPGFSFFRAPSKFMFFATLFVAPLIAAGVDEARKSSASVHVTAWIASAIALFLLFGTIWAVFSQSAPAGPDSLMVWLSWAAERPAPVGEALARWQGALWPALCSSAILAAASALLFFARKDQRVWPIMLLVIIGSVELTVFAYRNRFGTEVPLPRARIENLARAFEEAGEDRVLEIPGSNKAIYLGGFAVWGYDPIKLDRYAQFIARTQGRAEFDLANEAAQAPYRYDPRLAMLRTRFYMTKDSPPVRDDAALPRFLLLTDHVITDDAASARDAVFTPDFDPRRTVVLETAPDPPPRPGPVEGHVRLVSETTDSLDFEADLDGPAILLITDAFAEGWRARPLAGSDQASYQLLPANSVLRAIPLGAGHHRFRVEYAPPAFRAGATVSAAAWLGYAFAWGWSRRRRDVARPAARCAT